jgi:hypothetical protein
MIKMNKKGNILTENIIFIVLNLVFITILFIFLFSKTGAAAILEEKYAKQIALIIDAAEPGMIIDLNMGDAIKRANKENFPLGQIVTKNGNTINVRLREGSQGYSYSFFNDVDVNAHFDGGKQVYYFVISEK